MEQISENLEEICQKYGLTNENAWEIENIAKFRCVTKELLESALKDEKINLASNEMKRFIKEIIPIIEDTRIWTLNGFKMSELNQQIRVSKIGRNDLCPCGSGLKYKKCCGK